MNSKRATVLRNRIHGKLVEYSFSRLISRRTSRLTRDTLSGAQVLIFGLDSVASLLLSKYRSRKRISVGAKLKWLPAVHEGAVRKAFSASTQK